MTRTLLALSAVILAFGIAAPASAQDDPAVVMNFGAPHPQPAPPADHVLVPDEVTINKGGTVLFIMNGGGHRVNIYPVSKQTVRADIEEDLCLTTAEEKKADLKVRLYDRNTSRSG